MERSRLGRRIGSNRLEDIRIIENLRNGERMGLGVVRLEEIRDWGRKRKEGVEIGDG